MNLIYDKKDIVLHICEFLKYTDAIKLKYVNKSFNSTVNVLELKYTTFHLARIFEKCLKIGKNIEFFTNEMKAEKKHPLKYNFYNYHYLYYYHVSVIFYNIKDHYCECDNTYTDGICLIPQNYEHLVKFDQLNHGKPGFASVILLKCRYATNQNLLLNIVKNHPLVIDPKILKRILSHLFIKCLDIRIIDALYDRLKNNIKGLKVMLNVIMKNQNYYELFEHILSNCNEVNGKRIISIAQGSKGGRSMLRKYEMFICDRNNGRFPD